jgi:hypothetical protein
MKRNGLVYHYTTGTNLQKILRTGAILPATEHIPPGERGVVWFSSNLDYEPTAIKGLIVNGRRCGLNIEETEKYGGGLARIGVRRMDVPYDWQSLKQVARLKISKGLEIAARRLGSNVCFFYVSLEPVTADKWVSVELRDPQTKEWIDIQMWNARYAKIA